MDWTSLLAAVGIPIARGTAGWLDNALEDGKISEFELRFLAQTVMRIGFYSVLAYFGLGQMGFDVDAIGAAVGGTIFDLVIHEVRQLRKGK